MKSIMPLLDNQKLFVIYRIEAGCLGPRGNELIADFCAYTQAELGSLASGHMDLSIEPRNDKTLPETQYTLADKRISHSQAKLYLARFDKIPEGFDDNFSDRLEALISEYMRRRAGQV